MIRAVEAANGDFIVTGNVDTDTTIYPEAGAGSWDIYVIRLKPTGERVWEKLYGRKNLGDIPDTHDVPQHIYKNCPEGGGPCTYVITGYVSYSAPCCPYATCQASQVLVINDNGAVQNDFLMAGQSSAGWGAIKTIYTSDGNYLVLTDLFYDKTGLYTMGLQKYGPTGDLLWSRSYYEVSQAEGEYLLKIGTGIWRGNRDRRRLRARWIQLPIRRLLYSLLSFQSG